ncbi:hypothetical protein FACS189497_02030 [Betaproteobacteria bacterium]|nr:hypothetical protein FACS189488_02200 [Betaproteobacteria bacterium]GHU27893.1 hypothetical protein FACS189497_02030 [Betaproteobacteria bacterium]
MSSGVDFLRQCCDGKRFPPLPPPDAQGLSRLALERQLLLHVLADPQPSAPEQDDIFVYVALANFVGSAVETREALFWQLGAWNLPGGLPAGIRLGVERSSSLVWQSQRLVVDTLDERRFDATLQIFIATALERQAALQDILSNSAPPQGGGNLQADDAMLLFRSGGFRV